MQTAPVNGTPSSGGPVIPQSIQQNVAMEGLNPGPVESIKISQWESAKPSCMGRLCSALSGVGCLLLSPLFALGSLVSSVANKAFLSEPSNPTATTPPKQEENLALLLDNFIPDEPLSKEQLKMIADMKAKHAAENVLTDPTLPPNTSDNSDPPSSEPPSVDPAQPGMPENTDNPPSVPSEVDESSSPVEGARNPVKEGDDSIHGEGLVPEENSGISELSIQKIEEEPLPLITSGPVRIHGGGSCLFMAFAVGLKMLYADDASVTKLLNWNLGRESLTNVLNTHHFDLATDDAVINMLKPPASHLRQLATVVIEQELNMLRAWDAGLNFFEKHQDQIANNLKSNPSGRRLIHAANTVFQMKAAIAAYNEDINANIERSREAYFTNFHRGNNHIEFLINGENVGIAENLINSTGEALARNLKEIRDLCKKRIKCDPHQFNRAEIPEMLRYLEIMQLDTNYAGYPEVIALSSLFQVPLIIRDSDNNTELQFNTELDKPPIILDYNGRHFDLFLP